MGESGRMGRVSQGGWDGGVREDGMGESGRVGRGEIRAMKVLIDKGNLSLPSLFSLLPHSLSLSQSTLPGAFRVLCCY